VQGQLSRTSGAVRPPARRGRQALCRKCGSDSGAAGRAAGRSEGRCRLIVADSWRRRGARQREVVAVIVGLADRWSRGRRRTGARGTAAGAACAHQRRVGVGSNAFKSKMSTARCTLNPRSVQ